MTATLKALQRRLRLWPTLAIGVEIFPWHWIVVPWGYLHITGGLTFYFAWLGVSIHFGCTVTPRAAKKIEAA
jgi:hypothetical protein